MSQRSHAHIRDFHDDDLEGIVRLWELSHDRGETPVYSLAEVIASCQADHAVVAVSGDRILGAAVGRAAHAQGWIVFFRIDDDRTPALDAERIGAALLDRLERRMAPLGLGKLSVIVSDAAQGVPHLTGNGFEVRHHLRYFERPLPVQRRELDLLKEVGGRILPRRLWHNVAGMAREKLLLEERLVTPLAHPELAARYGVLPPRAVMLFGPPGTGKTTFAKAVASRLGWPFVEVFPSRLADSPAGLPAALRQTFEVIAELEHAVVFIDEVEEIASRRRGDPPSPTQGVTNELLKLLSEFRELEGRLLICATNFVRALDAAFLRHGRFDYVLPIGLPDADARRAIWIRYVPAGVVDGIDLDALVDASEGLTPADIEYAVRRAAQDALAGALQGAPVATTTGAIVLPDVDESPVQLETRHYQRALRSTRATVSKSAVRDFLEDIDALARL
ncbi:ATP-binding protein [Microbacterium sp. NPDC058062]|uniref:ATP-binding protein n=1 Tax=Microbacterium sp. NPDC058062 TaxID=3346320 RepID=UPI0036DB4B5B